MKACQNLGIKDVPLYPGTRHSSVTELGKHFSPEEVMAGTGHKTSKAFRRYFTVGADRRKQVSLFARQGENQVINFKTPHEKANLLKSQVVNGGDGETRTRDGD
jgi:hypothetical protein